MNSETLPFFQRAEHHDGRIALRDEVHGDITYRQLLAAAHQVADRLLDGRRDLEGERIAFLVPPSFEWVAIEWGTWLAGGIAVPLALSHPVPELAYTLSDSGATVAVASAEFAERLRPLAEERGLRFLTSDQTLAGQHQNGLQSTGSRTKPGPRPKLDPSRGAMILYTSGTTGQPKGAVLSHGNIQAQVESLVQAWQWSTDDAILEFLPLHHLHGIVNIIACALWSGARCEILPRFDADEVWRRLEDDRATLLMAVPTIYRRLISSWEAATVERQQSLSKAANQLRLMVSGSAALPVETLERWREITGHVLLERYGMTEIGMALSNPLDGERIPGAVGMPLPGVDVRLVNEEGQALGDGMAGEIEVRGAAVFEQYLGRPEITQASFRGDWFRTGDVAIRENHVYRILGRQSVDIIKTGGEKVSALEIESVLRRHPAICECAVVGISDEDWGERVAVAVVLEQRPASEEGLELESLRQWARDHLAPYKMPSRLMICSSDLPRNAMGKVIKPRVKELFEK